jgi:hypothetical protein
MLMKEWEIAEPVSELRTWCEKLFNNKLYNNLKPAAEKNFFWCS